ncbi:MAG: hypothetical protein KBA83_10260 [Fermentimonas sp.]|nr:hypothetical protein [Fermentimonas sp.]
MRNSLVILLSFSTSVAYSQFANTGGFSNVQDNQSLNSGVARNNLIDKSSGYNIEGSPFIFINYVKAEIVDATNSVFIRYNAMKDEIEIKEGNNVYVLPKEDKYSEINILETNQKLRLVTYADGKKTTNGYLFLLADNDNIKLYKKESVILTKHKEATNAYVESKPARYETQKAEFYIGLENGEVVEFPKNKKKLAELVPEKKNQISESNFNFNNENELIRLINSL